MMRARAPKRPRPSSSLTCQGCGSGLVDVRMTRDVLALYLRAQGWTVTKERVLCGACTPKGTA